MEPPNSNRQQEICYSAFRNPPDTFEDVEPVHPKEAVEESKGLDACEQALHNEISNESFMQSMSVQSKRISVENLELRKIISQYTPLVTIAENLHQSIKIATLNDDLDSEFVQDDISYNGCDPTDQTFTINFL